MYTPIYNQRNVPLFTRIPLFIPPYPAECTTDRHRSIVETLAAKPRGLSREAIVQFSGVKDGGTLTNVLRELEESGFINKSYPFGKKIKDSIYRLSDPYSLFFLKFIKDQHRTGAM